MPDRYYPARHHLLNREVLESLYHRFNDPAQVGLDPLSFVLKVRSPRDQEVVGLLAATLAYGNVKAIHASLDRVLSVMGPHPSEWLRSTSESDRARALPGFRHRWTSREDILGLWSAQSRLLRERGGMEACFLESIQPAEELRAGLIGLVRALRESGFRDRNRVLASPEDGSACKRMLMFLRWMVRSDRVDPGPWMHCSPAWLRMPVDVHIHRIARRWHLTRRKAADWKTAEEITRRFRTIAPEDPVRYDFALTRLAMRGMGEVEKELAPTGLRRLH